MLKEKINEVYFYLKNRWILVGGLTLGSILLALSFTLIKSSNKSPASIKSLTQLEITNKKQFENLIIDDVEKPLEFIMNTDFAPESIEIKIEPKIYFVKRKDLIKNSLLLYPDPRFSYGTKYHLQLMINSVTLLDIIFQTALSPSPTIIPISITPPQDFSEEEVKKWYDENPDQVVEAKLRLNSPIKEDGFTVTFSYKQRIFIVSLYQPYEENLEKFNRWFVAQGLKDMSHFTIEKK